MKDLLLKNIRFDGISLVNFVNLTESEKFEVLKWRNDDRVRTWMFNDKIIDRENHLKFISNLKDEKRNFYWIVRGETDDPAGVISINKIDTDNKNAYLGIYKNPFSSEKNAGAILINALKKIAFETCALHTLKLEVVSNNVRAIKFYEKNGFKHEGVLREFAFKNGDWLDVVIMGITSSEV